MAELRVTVGRALLPLMVTTVEPFVPTLYDDGDGVIDTTMYLSGWMTLSFSVSMVTDAVVLPADRVTTGFTGS